MRRTQGPKRNAEAWSHAKLSQIRPVTYHDEQLIPVNQVRRLLADAHQAGYRSAARKRRKKLIP